MASPDSNEMAIIGNVTAQLATYQMFHAKLKVAMEEYNRKVIEINRRHDESINNAKGDFVGTLAADAILLDQNLNILFDGLDDDRSDDE